MSGERTILTLYPPQKVRTQVDLDQESGLVFLGLVRRGMFARDLQADVIIEHEPSCELESGGSELCECRVRILLVEASSNAAAAVR